MATPTSFRRAAFVLPVLLLSMGLAKAQPDTSLADLSLEQLAALEVTSVGKRLQRLSEVAGSVYVIRSEEIRRSGATTVAEALRLAPNLFVARADAAQYAITARTGADLLANKLLVLVDGRTVYSPLFSGVFWEAQDLLLEDVERIEVLSGSGGTLYGSNAFNGVINVVTRAATETQGTLVSAFSGKREHGLGGRQGGTTAGGLAWRGHAKVTRQDARVPGTLNLVENAERRQAGFRADGATPGGLLTVQGDVFEHDLDEPTRGRRYAGLNLLGRVTQQEQGARHQLQAYVDRSVRKRPGAIGDTLDTLDVEYQRESHPWAGHDLLWGAGWRQHWDRSDSDNPAATALVPAQRRLRLFNVFVQDEWSIAPQWDLTLGLKAESNSYTGLEYLPSARLAWQAAPRQLLWASASRTVRKPARIDREVFAPPLLPSPAYGSEYARVYELGWRGEPSADFSASATVFHHDFSRLRSLDLAPGGATFRNHYSGRLTGIEAWADWRLADAWRLRAGMVEQRVRYEAAPGTAPLFGTTLLGNDAPRRYTLSLAWDVSPSVELDLRLRRIGALPAPAVPSYTAMDLRWGWRVNPALELSATLRNAGERRHVEWGPAGARSELARSLVVQAVWRH